MARLRAELYQLACTKRAKRYFPSRVRVGLMVRIENDHGAACQAEYAPLEGIHQHQAHHIKTALEGLSAYGLDEMMALDPNLDPQELARIFKQRWSYPVSFILSCAYFHLHLRRFVDKNCNIKLSGLVLDDLGEAKDFISAGYSCLKLKVGTSVVQKEIERISATVLMGGNMSLRLDANKRLSLKAAQSLLSGLKHLDIQYFEEPLDNPLHLPHLFEQSGIDLALDESWSENSSWTELRATKAKFLIFKPSRYSSIFWIIDRCRQALEQGMTPIVSSCFESDWSVAINALLASLIAPQDAHGIGAEGLFYKEIHNTLPISQGQIATVDAFNFLEYSRGFIK